MNNNTFMQERDLEEAMQNYQNQFENQDMNDAAKKRRRKKFIEDIEQEQNHEEKQQVDNSSD